MNYYLYFFSPKTWKSFCEKGLDTAGVQRLQRNTLKNKIKEGDLLIAYCVKFSRFVGVLEFKGGIREDLKPYFLKKDDPFTWRFDVSSKVFVKFEEKEKAVPLEYMIENSGAREYFIKERNLDKSDTKRIITRVLASIFGQFSLSKINPEIAKKVVDILEKNKETFEITEREQKALDRSLNETVEENEDEIEKESDEEETTKYQEDYEAKDTHTGVQTKLVELGLKWGYEIWVPNSDRNKVLDCDNKLKESDLLKKIPMNYADSAVKIVKNIDVLWIRGNSMPYAFEVEHSTSIYSGLLRLNDLNLDLPDIKTKFIVVSDFERYEKFNKEIQRPTFSNSLYSEHEPLIEKTAFLSYDRLNEIFNCGIKLQNLNPKELEDKLDLPEKLL